MMVFNNTVRLISLFLLIFTISSCSGFSKNPKRAVCHNTYEAGKYTGHYKIGKPYTVKNETYVPKLDHSYSEEGNASWYGDYFHCRSTANGSVFNKNEMTAAHKTLPLPSIAKVTNLSNGKTVKVIINDRGPFVKGRIIDLSEKAAHAIGIKHQGVGKVKVEYLHDESSRLLAKLNLDKYKNIKSKSTEKRLLASKTKGKAKKQNNIYNLQLADSIISNRDIEGKELKKYIKLVGEFSSKKDALKHVEKYSENGLVRLSQIYKNGVPVFQVHLTSAGPR
jgi:rare lipoprotein A